MTRDEAVAYAVDHEFELIFFEPAQYFDHAIVGIVHGFGQEPAVVYDQAAVLNAMAKDMGHEGALEWFGFNTIGAYAGEATPRFLMPFAAPVDLLDGDATGSAATGSAGTGRPPRRSAAATDTAPKRRRHG